MNAVELSAFKPSLYLIIIYMKKLLDSDWLRAVQFKWCEGKSIALEIEEHEPAELNITSGLHSNFFMFILLLAEAARAISAF